MSNPRNATPSNPPSHQFLARRLSAALAAAGMLASLGLPAPAVLAAEPVPEVYAKEATLVRAGPQVSVKVLNDASSIAVISPMSTGGLRMTTRANRSASGGTTYNKAFAAAAETIPTNCYDLMYGPLIDIAGGLEFPPVGLESPAIKRVVTISNSGPAPVVFDGFPKATGDFSAASNCGGTLGVGESCTIDLSVAPQQVGSRQGLLTIPLAGPGPSLSVPLIAESVPGVYGYNYPYCLDFNPTMVGSSSFPESAYVYGSDYSVEQVGLDLVPGLVRSPDFAIADSFCEVTYVDPYGYYSNEYCQVDVEFRPTLVGPLMGRMLMRSNSQYPLADVWLLGTGLEAPAGRLTRSTSLLNFGLVDQGLTSPPQSVRLTNTSSSSSGRPPQEVGFSLAGPKALEPYGAPVRINSITVSGDYAQDNDCGTLDPGESCTVNVTFTPTAMGERPGVLSVESDASNPLLTVSLTGIGSGPVPLIQLSAGSVSFGSGVMGRPAGEQVIVVKSVGRADLLISGIYTTGDFDQTNSCPAVLPPGAECEVTVRFVATIPGEREGSLVVLSNAAPGFREASLEGWGCRPFGPAGSRLADPGCN